MKRLILISLFSISFITHLSSFAPLELEEKAEQWISTYATNGDSKAFNLSLEQTELLATALFYSYQYLKLDEVPHTCNRITVFFHKVLPTNLEQEHNLKLSAQTVASFSTFMENGKKDLLEAYATAAKNFETAIKDLVASNDSTLINAYNSVKETVNTSVEKWSKEEGVQLSQAALNNLTEQQTAALFTFALDSQFTQEKASEILAHIPLENLQNFFTYQTEAHAFIKSIWQTHLTMLIESAEKAGHTKIKLRGKQEKSSNDMLENN